MTYNQNRLLDIALTMLRDKENPHIAPRASRTMTVLATKLYATEMGIPDDIAQALLDTLVENKHAEPTDGGYTITPKGRLFNENEGYRWTAFKKTIIKIVIIINATVIAVGTIGLFILELQKYHSNCICK